MTGTELREGIASSPEIVYRKFIDEYGGYVYAIAFNKLRSVCTTAEIDECVSDVFAEIFMKYSSAVCDERDMRGYTGTVAKRRAVDYFRKYTSEKTKIICIDEETAGTVVSDIDIEKDSDKKEMQSILLHKIEQLGEPDSEIIIRKFYYDQNSSEIARKLNLKASSVRSRCKRALERLKSMLAEAGISM